MSDRCPVCGGAWGEPFLRLERVPVLANALAASADEARRAPAGDVDLARCEDCGLIANLRFDPALTAYSPAYENALHHSGVFRSYQESLAASLVERFGLRGRRIVEVGCGSGDFLARLCALGGNEGIGYDPSARLEQGLPDAAPGALRVERRDFRSGDAAGADCLIARHVFEHVAEPVGLLAAMRADARPDAAAYVEVPDAAYMLRSGAIWDVIYEHCTYFDAAALSRLFVGGGWTDVEASSAYEGQYLAVTARAGGAPGSSKALSVPEVDAAQRQAEAQAFGSHAQETIDGWDERLRTLAADGPVVAWGAGSKGITFLNVVPGAERVTQIVDLNPGKHGRFVPGSAHPVVAPEVLNAIGPAHVIVMNPLYADEVRATLSSLDVDARVHVAI